MRPPPPNMRAARPGGYLSAEMQNYLSDLAAAISALQVAIRGRAEGEAVQRLSAEARQRLEGERRLREAAIEGVLGEIERAAEERRQAAADNATLTARVRALEILANIGIGAVDAMVPPLQAPGVRPGEPPPAPPAPALPDYLGTGGARVLVASTPLFYTDTDDQRVYPVVARDEGGGAPDWTRPASAPAAMYLVAAAEGLSPLGVTASGVSGFLRWEWEIRDNAGTVQATLRVPVRQVGSATAAIPYTNGSATSVVSYTATNRLSIAADGARAVGDTICVPQNDAPGLTPLAAGHTFPNDCRVYLVPVA